MSRFERPLPFVILSDAKNLVPRVPSWGAYQVKEILLVNDSSTSFLMVRMPLESGRW